MKRRTPGVHTVAVEAVQLSRQGEAFHLHLQIGGAWLEDVAVIPIDADLGTTIVNSKAIKAGLSTKRRFDDTDRIPVWQ